MALPARHLTVIEPSRDTTARLLESLPDVFESEKRWRSAEGRPASMGVQSVPLVIVTGVLSGVVTSQQGGYQFTSSIPLYVLGSVVTEGVILELGPVLHSPPGAPPYPDIMNRAAVDEIVALDPDTVIAKGDLTSDGSDEQFKRFLQTAREVAAEGGDQDTFDRALEEVAVRDPTPQR